MSAEYNFCHIQGSTFKKRLSWNQNNIPTNLTGYTAKMQIRSSYNSPIVIELSTENSRIILGGINGTIDLKIEDSVIIEAGNYYYDLDLYSTTETYTLLKGRFQIISEITK
jgi:hypothetical protein